MKMCNRCSTEKSEESFSKDSSKKDGLRSLCRECDKARLKKRYPYNREKSLVNAKKQYRKKMDWLQKIKTDVGCYFCDESDAVALDFHHRDPDQKLFKIGGSINLVGRGRLQAEIDKCIVVCANCHRKIHAGKLKLPAIEEVR